MMSATRAVAVLALALSGWGAGEVAAQQVSHDTAAAPAGQGAPSRDEAIPDLARAVAADPVLEARATRLAAELRCPVCQGLAIQDSPSPLALQMKDLIRTQVARGYSDDEIRQYFVSKYGEWVLLEPRASGFNLLVYILPAAALLAGLGLVAVAVRRWTAPVEERPAA